jgi:hypothetical protein
MVANKLNLHPLPVFGQSSDLLILSINYDEKIIILPDEDVQRITDQWDRETEKEERS